jgi:hypothetical protein
MSLLGVIIEDRRIFYFNQCDAPVTIGRDEYNLQEQLEIFGKRFRNHSNVEITYAGTWSMLKNPV